MFSLFKSHLDLAHFWWQKIVTKDSLVVDMTLGNGHDSAFLAGLEPKRLLAVDIQEAAIESAKALIKGPVECYLEDHALFPERLDDQSVALAVYNLGWLPGSDKTVTTTATGTLLSLERLLPKMAPQGVISITCYPGHAEGKIEEDALLERLQQLDPKKYSVCHHRWLNRHLSPSLILIQKSKDPGIFPFGDQN